MLTTTAFRGSQQSFRLFALTFCATRRTYALSRFPQRPPGVGRRRQHVEKDSYLNNPPPPRPTREDMPREDPPSSETSSLWRASTRSIDSNPAEGLRHLLMTHESLVVTRSAFSAPTTGKCALTSAVHSQIEMLNIFIGFEQTNKYTICWSFRLLRFVPISNDSLV
jgi:hypothetical protein